MKISSLIEDIFATAVQISQEGGLRNTIYAINKEIYILNFDHTLLIRFRLRESEAPFASPISFHANDYDSDEFYEEDGKIVFVTRQGDFQRKKTCGTPGMTPDQVKELFRRYVHGAEGQKIELNKSILDLLDKDLSHIEFSGQKGGSIILLQRNIYDGTLIEVKQKADGFHRMSLEDDFGPIAMKTNDFAALFNFQDALKFTFPYLGKDDYVLVRSMDRIRRDMTAIVACSLYDEVAEIREAKQSFSA